jgi:hypothetical protein
LAAKLDHDALGLLALTDGEDRGRIERLEVEAVARVVIGRDSLGVRVHHHRLVAERAERLCGVHAAVIELDPLADAVGTAAEDDDARGCALRRSLVGLIPGRVVVRRFRGDLARA